jgi:hypothetical protein
LRQSRSIKEPGNTAIVSTVNLALHPFQQSEDGHRMTVTQFKIIFEPLDDCACLNAGCKSPILCESFFLGESPEVSGTFAGLRLDIRKVCLE